MFGGRWPNRDQHKITADDPQILGPYAEPGHAGHKAYWHAAESVLAARQLARLEPANGTPADSRASAQLAADIYRNLPDDQHAAVAELVAMKAGHGANGGGPAQGPTVHRVRRPRQAAAGCRPAEVLSAIGNGERTWTGIQGELTGEDGRRIADSSLNNALRLLAAKHVIVADVPCPRSPRNEVKGRKLVAAAARRPGSAGR